MISDAKKQARQQIEAYFRKTANDENNKNQKVDLWTLFDKNRPNKRVLITCPESRGDIFYVTALLQSAKQQYPDCDIYFCCKPEYFDMLEGNELIYKIIPHHSVFESEMHMIGAGQDKGFIDIFIMPTIATQKHLNYLSNNHPVLPDLGEPRG